MNKQISLISRFLMSLILGLSLTGLTSIITKAQTLPVTTSSQEALQLFKEGQNKLANVQRNDAEALFQQAIQKDPNFAQAYLFLALSSGDYNVINNSLKKAEKLSDKASPDEQKFIKCVLADYEGNNSKQKRYLDQLLNKYPNDNIIQMTAGNYYYGQNEYQTAIEHYNKALAANPDFAQAYNMIGYCQSQLGNYEESENAFKSYIKMVPNNPNPHDSYAELLMKMGKYDESIAQYNQALKIDPDFISAYRGIGDNYIFKGDFATARTYYDKQFDHAKAVGDKLNAMRMKTISYVHEGNIPEAIQTLDKERTFAQNEKQIPDIIDTHLTSSLIYSMTGNPQEGLKHNDEAASLIEKEPLPDPLKKLMTVDMMLNRTHVLTMSGQYDQAMAEANEVKKMIDQHQNKNEMENWNLAMGVLQVRQNKNEEALSYLKKANSDSPVTWFYKASAYEKMGNKEKSAKLYKKVGTWNVNNIGLALVRNTALNKMKSSGVSTSETRK